MNLVLSDDILAHTDNILHADTQLHTQTIDLTVASINRPIRTAALDFGGGEFEPAGMEELPPVKRNSDDDYGWWNLQEGSYQAKCNELFSLGSHSIAIVSLHQHMIKAGLIGSSGIITEDQTPIINFSVPNCGCNIKENARIATACLIEH